MTRRRVVAVGLVVWIVVLGITLQPHPPRRPAVTHARRLDPPDRNLPTLPLEPR